MNQAHLIGRLTRDPEYRQTPNGISVCTFSIAVTRRFNRDEADFLNIVTWRGLADNCGKYLTKGQQVGVSGRIQSRSYDGNDGKKRYVTEIVADTVDFLSPAGAKGTNNSDAAAPQADDAPPESDELFGAGGGTFTPVDDDNLPF
ncbi:MAG: single-stranded DNA-binding protein [Eubacteriales bacterium]